MTGITGHQAPPAKVSLVDVVHHHDHHPRHAFPGNVVRESFPMCEACIHVTMNTVQSKSGGKEAHCIQKLANWDSFQHLDILEYVLCALRLLAWSGLPVDSCYPE